MDEYDFGTASTFDTHNRWSVSTTAGAAAIFSSNSTNSHSLRAELDQEEDHVALISHDKRRKTINGDKTDINDLYRNWGLPKITAESLLGQGEPKGLYALTDDKRCCIWYYLPVVNYGKGWEWDKLEICTIINTESLRARTLVFCPQTITNVVSAELQKYLNSQINSQSTSPTWPTQHLIFAKYAVQTWEDFEWAIRKKAEAAALIGNIGIEHALEATPFHSIDDALQDLHSHETYINDLEYSMTSLFQELTKLLKSKNSGQRVLEVLDVLRSNIKRQFLNYKFIKELLLIHRKQLSSSVGLKNASYMRNNTIALRRIAQENAKETQEMKIQSQQALEASRTMTKISHLTMFYLPATFIATLFSTPFFQLDENLKFAAFRKVWIYVLVAVLSTTTTLLASYILDKLAKFSSVQAHNDREPQELRPDTNLLEPPAVNLLGVDELAQLLQKLGGAEFEEGEHVGQEQVAEAS